MNDDKPDFAAMTDSELADIVREGVGEIRRLRRSIHDAGDVSEDGESIIAGKQKDINEAERELARRRINGQHKL